METPEKSRWRAMKARCFNPNNRKYPRYGARGITVCERWLVFENFLADMGPRPSPRHSIDRINNDGNYEPSNCRWATMPEQMRNSIAARWVTFNGETLTVTDWAQRLGITQGSMSRRLSVWPLERAMTQGRDAFRGRNAARRFEASMAQ